MAEVMTPTVVRVHHELIVAGFGGQGVQKLGLTLAEAAMHEGREVVWTPAYGPEMRGGPSFCTVIVSSDPIGAPVVDKVASAIFMDRPSVPKYQQRVRENGFIIINTTLVDGSQLRTDIPCYGIQANKIAEEIGDQRVANMIVLGTFIKLSGLISAQTVMGALEEALPERHRHLLPLNERALAAGAEYFEQVIVPTR